jgi:hypothetical protein
MPPEDDENSPARSRGTRRGTKRFLLYAGVGLVVVFAGIQFVPYRVSNPPVQHEPAWDTPRTRQLAVAACFNCHSNETNTIWFEDIAPLSWWITNHVDGGRAKLNFSECTPGSGDEKAAETVTDGTMPPGYYTWFGLHPDAKLSKADRAALAAGLRATLRDWNCGGEDRQGGHD